MSTALAPHDIRVADQRPALRVARLTRIPSQQLLRFAAVGVISTLAYIGLYAGLRLGMAAQLANAVALLTTAIANTAANRRVTFDVRGRANAVRHQLQGLGVFSVALAITSGSLAALNTASDQPSRPIEIAVLIIANLVATALRFVLLRRVFRRSQP